MAAIPKPPPDLQVGHFSIGDDEFALFEWPTGAELPQNLSKAEREVAELALRGLSNAQIAKTRGTSIRTVANQLVAAYRKLNVASRLELFACAGRRNRR